MPSADIDVRSDIFNMEDNTLDDVLDGMIETIEIFRKKVNGRPIHTIFKNGNPSLGVVINPRGDGDFWFWIGGQVR